MCIDKKLLLLLLFSIFALNLAIGQTQRNNPAFDNPEAARKIFVEVYPNPTADFLHVEIKQSELSSVKFEMYNIIGNTMHVDYEQIGKNLFRIPVRDLSTGYYLLIVQDEETRFRKAFKFMKI